MLIISFNIANVRATRAARFFSWAITRKPDLVCLQSTAVSEERFPDYAELPGYQRFSDHQGAVSGTNGVAIYSRYNAVLRTTKVCDHVQCSGRYIEVALQSGLNVASTYIRSGGDKITDSFQKQHFRCIANHMRSRSKDTVVVAGDFNLALDHLDRHEAKEGAYGFRRDDRQLFRDLERNEGWIDSFRHLNPSAQIYSRWPTRKSYPSKGWRIDYQWASRALRDRVVHASISVPADYEDRFSDHAPTLGEYSV